MRNFEKDVNTLYFIEMTRRERDLPNITYSSYVQRYELSAQRYELWKKTGRPYKTTTKIFGPWRYLSIVRGLEHVIARQYSLSLTKIRIFSRELSFAETDIVEHAYGEAKEESIALKTTLR